MNNSDAIDVIKSNYPPDNYSMLREALDMSIELLELDIVRCKDCKNLKARDGYADRYLCTRWNNTTAVNEFCSYARRKG